MYIDYRKGLCGADKNRARQVLENTKAGNLHPTQRQPLTKEEENKMKHTPITLEQAKTLRYRQILAMNDQFNADRTCVRWRVNGAVKTWKTRPNEFRIPVKHGMYDFDYVDQDNIGMFHIYGTCPNC